MDYSRANYIELLNRSILILTFGTLLLCLVSIAYYGTLEEKVKSKERSSYLKSLKYKEFAKEFGLPIYSNKEIDKATLKEQKLLSLHESVFPTLYAGIICILLIGILLFWYSRRKLQLNLSSHIIYYVLNNLFKASILIILFATVYHFSNDIYKLTFSLLFWSILPIGMWFLILYLRKRQIDKIYIEKKPNIFLLIEVLSLIPIVALISILYYFFSFDEKI